MEHIVFLDRSTIRAQFRAPAFPHTWRDYDATAASEVVARLAEATLAITNKVQFTRDILSQLPDLKLIAVTATGYNNVDIAACRERGVAVANVRGYALHTVPEHVFAMVFALRRNLTAYREDILQGRWQQESKFCFFDYPLLDLHGSTLGIIGAGTLGRETGRIGEALGMRVLYAQSLHGDGVADGRVPLDQLLAESDVVSLHCPLTEATRGLIGERELQAMKPGALLINTARGGIVDEAALAQALQQGWIAGAGVDVLTEEPPRHGNPLLEIKTPNLIITPHVAWASEQAMQSLADQVLGNIEAFVAGRPQNLVT